MKTKHSTLRIGAAYALYGVLAFAPVVVAVALDWDVYTSDVRRCASLSVAGAIAALLIVMQAVGHTPRHVKRVVWYAVAAAVLWLLKPLVASLALLVTCMALGEGLAMLVAKPLIASAKRSRDNATMADAVADAVKEVNGRV